MRVTLFLLSIEPQPTTRRGYVAQYHTHRTLFDFLFVVLKRRQREMNSTIVSRLVAAW